MAGREYIDEGALAYQLGLSKRTLQRWRWRKVGPPYMKLGTRVVYRLSDIAAWAESVTRRPANPSPDRPE